MAVVDAYGPCPCGSGQKFKWCCQKVEPFAEKAERLFATGQADGALAALDEGLRKVPDNPWLLLRKALIFERQDQFEPARQLLSRLLARQPDHLGANALLVRVAMEADGPVAGVAQLQHALSAVPEEAWPSLAVLAQVVGVLLARVGNVPAALMHLELAEALGLEDEATLAQVRRSIEGDPSVSPYLKSFHELSTAPDTLSDEHRARFDEALEWGRSGLWQSAASAFDTLSAEVGGAEVDRNLGLCRLWLADDAGAVEALRRSVAWAGPTTDSVDLEALCQRIAPPARGDMVEQVHLIFPLRDRDRLLSTLRARPDLVEEGRTTLDPDDPIKVEVDTFALLDRPQVAKGAVPESIDAIPRVAARVLVGLEIVIVETFDLGQLDELGDRFREIAVPAIPPAHPKTKVIERASRSALALHPEAVYPEGLPREASHRLVRAERDRTLFQTWPKTPMPYLGGRTPEQAAKAGDAEVPLRAALCQFETDNSFLVPPFDFPALRARLGVEPEPEIDPATVDVERLHLSRLWRVPADKLDDEKLLVFYLRAREGLSPQAMRLAARAIADRPSALARPEIDRLLIFSDLANLATSHDDLGEAFEWIKKGRSTEPQGLKAVNAPRWDMLEVRLRARTEGPESWVPQLAIVLDRYASDRDASQAIMSNLLDMGLVRVVPNPDNRDDVMLDSRRLQAVLQEYGPKVTTASGGLGVSAAKGELWTPGGPSGGGGGSGGGLWTPGGSTAASGGEKPKLIIPGR